MESNKLKYSIADYSVSQTTLDQVFINFAKSQRGKDSEDEEDYEQNDDAYYDEEEEETTNQIEQINEKPISNMNDLQLGSLESSNNKMSNDNPTFESIKNHFNSLKKSRHSRKTSSAKSVNRNQSLRSRKSRKSNASSMSKRASISEAGFTNLAYEIEFKNSDACDLPNLTNSFNEDGEIFSRC
jgi:hypothetical protein